jgi:hypothetical protein
MKENTTNTEAITIETIVTSSVIVGGTAVSDSTDGASA